MTAPALAIRGCLGCDHLKDAPTALLCLHPGQAPRLITWLPTQTMKPRWCPLEPVSMEADLDPR